jgi:collagen type III alpha
LSPGQMAWPMPPGTPPAIRHPDGPQYLNFQQTGETVVRISQPPRSSRRSGGY